MKILMTGGTGFIGKILCEKLLTEQHEVWVLTRDKKRAAQRLPSNKIHLIEKLTDIADDVYFDAVINLAGAPIDRRWSTQYKQILMHSRLDITKQLIAFISTRKQKPEVLISGSAIGYYGNQSLPVTESAAPSPSFSHDLCQAWESTAFEANALGVRVCCLRTGIVLGKNGGALNRMRLPFSFGLGGQIGAGLQGMSWIHLDDMVNVILFCLTDKTLSGPINATAPSPIDNKTFTQTYAAVLHRPAIIPVPAFMVRLLFGQMGEELLLQGQKVIPEKLQQQGFTYQYPQLKLALLEIEK